MDEKKELLLAFMLFLFYLGVSFVPVEQGIFFGDYRWVSFCLVLPSVSALFIVRCLVLMKKANVERSVKDPSAPGGGAGK